MKIGLFYNVGSHKTAKVAEIITQKLGADSVTVVDVTKAAESDFKTFDKLIFGVPTWFDGELPSYWDELVPLIEDISFKGKKVAIFGNGNQKDYSENFGDAVGIMAEIMQLAGAKIVGHTSTSKYAFQASKALVDGNKFCGLILDFENQAKMNDERITHWVTQLKQEF